MVRWLKRIGLSLLVLVGLSLAGGVAYEQLARNQARKAYPAPGRLVDIGGGRHIQIDCRGQGGPTVVFESGLDTLGSLSWDAVHDKVAQTTRACAYSRAGVMWSDPAPRPFSATHVAQDLHAALAAVGEKGPYVLVGHSLGGPYLMTFVGLYGGDVAGVVLVDASHPDQIDRLRAAGGQGVSAQLAQAKLAGALAWTGIVRAVTSQSPPVPPTAPAAIRGPAAAWLPQTLGAPIDETQGLVDTLATAGRTRQLGDRPLVVLTHGAETSPEVLKAQKVTAQQDRAMTLAWQRMQGEEARWSTHSRHQIVADASHYIQFDRPDVVVAAVREVVEDVRVSRPAATSTPPHVPGPGQGHP